MRYSQIRNRLVRCIGSLHMATAQDRKQMMDGLTGDGNLTDSDDSPSNGYGYEAAFKVETYKQMHNSLVTLLECGTLDELTEILEVFAEAFSAPPEHGSSDESMPEETGSARLTWYRNAEQCEVSDPDEWASIHYGAADPVDGEMEEF